MGTFDVCCNLLDDLMTIDNFIIIIFNNLKMQKEGVDRHCIAVN